MKVIGTALQVSEDRWRFGLITEDDFFHTILEVVQPNGFPIESKFAAMPLNEALKANLAWVAENIEDGDVLIDEMIAALSRLRSCPYPTV